MKKNQTYLLTNLEEKLTRKNDTYLVCTLSDQSGSIYAKVWNMSLEKTPLKTGTVYDCRLNESEYQGEKSYELESFSKSKEPVSHFVPAIEEDPESLYEELMEVAKELRPSLRDLVVKLYEDHKQALLTRPAAKTVHHNLMGGLLFHTYCMLKSAPGFMEVYPDLDYDLVFAGIMLHDIGKVEELMMDEKGQIGYTPIGTLHGHMPIGYYLVRKTGEQLGTDPEDLMLLCHIILSHQGLREYESCALPSVPEAYLIHALDMVDSRLFQFKAIQEDLKEGMHTEKAYPTLGGCRVYKRKEEINEQED